MMSRAEISAAVLVVLGLAGWTGAKIFTSVVDNREKIAHNRDLIAAVELKAAVTGALVERFHPAPLAEKGTGVDE